MAANKVLHLEELFQRELADLARDEELLREAFGLFAQASSNPVLEELFGRIKRDADDLAQKLAELAEKTNTQKNPDELRSEASSKKAKAGSKTSAIIIWWT